MATPGNKDTVKMEFVQIKYRSLERTFGRKHLLMAVAVVMIVVFLEWLITAAMRPPKLDPYENCLRGVREQPTTEDGKRRACHLNGEVFEVVK
jgi:hypothetical protein